MISDPRHLVVIQWIVFFGDEQWRRRRMRGAMARWIIFVNGGWGKLRWSTKESEIYTSSHKERGNGLIRWLALHLIKEEKVLLLFVSLKAGFPTSTLSGDGGKRS
jgi:hypothetical protein